MPAARPAIAGWTEMLTGWAGVTIPPEGGASHLLPWSRKTFVVLVKGLLERLVTCTDCLAGSAAPAVPTNIRPVGRTVGLRLPLAGRTDSTSETACGELATPSEEI